MLVAVWAAAFAMGPCEMKAFGEESAFVIKRGGFKDCLVFRRNEKEEAVRLVFQKTVRLLEDGFQQWHGVSTRSDRAIEADSDGTSTHAVQ